MKDKMLKINEYMTVKEAAEFIGVCKHTLRKLTDKKKIKSHRNSMNNFRMYKKEDLLKILERIEEC